MRLNPRMPADLLDFPHQSVDDIVQPISLHDLRKIIQREIDAMIRNAALRKIIGTNSLRTVA